jgi:hypothetical protein
VEKENNGNSEWEKRNIAGIWSGGGGNRGNWRKFKAGERENNGNMKM